MAHDRPMTPAPMTAMGDFALFITVANGQCFAGAGQPRRDDSRLGGTVSVGWVATLSNNPRSRRPPGVATPHPRTPLNSPPGDPRPNGGRDAAHQIIIRNVLPQRPDPTLRLFACYDI